MSFAIRGEILGVWTLEFGLTNAEAGLITGAAFWGFLLSMIIGGPLCDVLGIGRLVALALIGHVAGALLTIFAGGFWSLLIATLLVGIGNGFVEAACNPLIATLYPDNKVTKLNYFHVWFPGGIVIGGLLAYTGQSGKTAQVLLGMAVFGLTMATPFVILSLVPARLPKSGEWMNSAKIFLGFVEIAAALKFLSNTDLKWQLNMLSRELFLWLWVVILAMAGGWMMRFF